MDDEQNAYYAYLLRLWRTQYLGRWHWRASLECPHTGERQSFTGLDQLFAFLKEQCEAQEKTNSETTHLTRR